MLLRSTTRGLITVVGRNAAINNLYTRSFAKQAAGKAKAAGGDPWASVPANDEDFKAKIAAAMPDVQRSGDAANLAQMLYVATEMAEGAPHAEVGADLDRLAGLLKTPEWLHFFTSPIIPVSERVEALTSLAKEAKLHQVTAEFLVRVGELKATHFAPELIKIHKEILTSGKNEVVVDVVTAETLSEAHKTQLSQILNEHYVAPGSKVLLTHNVDPSLGAGLTLTVGNSYIDLSARSRVESIFQAMNDAVDSHYDRLMSRKV